jgi:hypothetical protein
MQRIAALAVVAGCTSSSPSKPPLAPAPAALVVPTVHVVDPVSFPDFDGGFCRGSMVPVQDPIFPTIRRSRFTIDPATDLVAIPPDWIAEARDVRIPQLRAAAAARLPSLLGKVVELVGRGFDHHDFDYYFYLCPYFGGGTASAKVYPMFMYLRAAVGDLAWPDWLFTDQYLFHEVLHNYVLERVDYTKGTPILNAMYVQLVADADFIARSKAHLGFTGADDDPVWQREFVGYVALVLTHIHVYAAMTSVLRALGEEERLQTIRAYEMANPAPHPSYVKAWDYVIAVEHDPTAMAQILAEVR